MGGAAEGGVLGLAVVGIGGWGRNLLRAFAQTDGAKVRRVCDSSPERLRAAARQCPGAAAGERFEEVLADGTVQAVVLATPAVTHAELAARALRAGRHVYVEKPMALRSSDARELVALAEERHLCLMVGHLLEYHPAVDCLRNLVAGGELGEVRYMHCERVNLGVVRRDENALWSLAPHDISIVLHLFGAEPETVSSRGSCWLQKGVEDVVFTNLRFADGRMAQIHNSWLDPRKERRMVLVGSRKMAVFDDMSPTEKIRIYDKGAEVQRDGADSIGAISVRHGEIRIPLVSAEEPLAAEVRHFVDCVREGRTPRSDGRDGLRVVRVLEAASESLRGDGVPVRLAE